VARQRFGDFDQGRLAMSIAIDHGGIPASDPRASARFPREILPEGETSPEGPGGGMANLSVGDSAPPISGWRLRSHVALRVTGLVLAGAIGRLRQRHVPFGRSSRPGESVDGRPARG